MSALWKLPMAEQIEAMRTGRVPAETLVREYLDRLQKFGGKNGLNVLAQVNPRALEEARALDRAADKSAPLFGLPILVKDNIDVAGLYTTAGSRALADNLAKTDAPVIENLRKAGAVILGKANLTEFANFTALKMPNGFSSFGGQVVHAYDPALDPSGSSTGSAVAVSAGLCAAAIGTDTSFSVVACAMANGVTGLKPAHGSLPGEGIVPIACLLDSAGPITRTLEDAVRVYAAMRGEPVTVPEAADAENLRLLVNTANRDKQSEIQRSMTDALLQTLRDAGVTTEETERPYPPQLVTLMRGAFQNDLNAYLAGTAAKNRTLADIIEDYKRNPAWMPYGIDLLEKAAACSVDDPDYRNALDVRARVRAEQLQELSVYDACVMTGPTSIMHFCGFPSLSIRMGMGADGVPRGLILYGADEQKLLKAALCIEKYTEPVVWPPNIE